MRTVALDAMGGDRAPLPELEGALAAVREGIARVILVGDEPRLRAELARLGGSQRELTMKHASQVITMDDAPAQAARVKKDSSMRVAFDLVLRGEADAVVSAGNSGAMMACALFVWDRVHGLDRPAIVTSLPTRTHPCALLDTGANVECRPSTLAQFAVLGSVYAQLMHGRSRPRVGLLANGQEPGKGTELTREAHRLLSGAAAKKSFEFVGHVEGGDLFSGALDVAVTDGFTGNVALKTGEAAGKLVLDLLRQTLAASRLGRLGALLCRRALFSLDRRLDWAEYGGAPLCGARGTAVLCHGGSTAKAIKNGIRVASALGDADLAGAVAAALGNHNALWAGEPALS